MNCPINKKHKIIMIEYDYGDPYRYDGISEIKCLDCGKRYGRWTLKELKDGEQEPPFGKPEYITNKAKIWNMI